MAKLKKSFAEVTHRVRLMASALQRNLPEVEKRGIDIDFINQLKAKELDVLKINNEQDFLRAKLKGKTEELNAKLSEIKKQLSEAKKVAKLATPKTKWGEFGISDKR
ncbi:hypothetical protein [Capnocytophaga sp.]|uniref:hypothetical protein n=1 Tax=Capnocytophaga sp. TaxID=44737 RepID=UPI0026DB8514|nr:hypothetical protein [Capnocytophaga sp.]MDO5104483.1 hypothetical protein [Capnocytophaga sp.]